MGFEGRPDRPRTERHGHSVVTVAGHRVEPPELVAMDLDRVAGGDDPRAHVGAHGVATRFSD